MSAFPTPEPCAGHLDDPAMTLACIFARWPQTPGVFIRHRMLCYGCPVARFHTVLDAVAEYGLEEAAFRAELRVAAAPAASRTGTARTT